MARYVLKYVNLALQDVVMAQMLVLNLVIFSSLEEAR